MRKLLIVLAIVVVSLAACSPEETGYQYSDLPPGDAAHGGELFTQSVNGAAACSGCHTLTGGDSAGPSLENYATVAGSRVDGQSAEEYTFNSILQPSKHLVQGFSNIMPGDYEDKLSQQEVSDLIAYTLTLGGNGSTAAQVSGEGEDSVDLYMIVVRLLHILGMVVWLGSGIFTIAFLQPAVSGMGMEGQRFMQSFFRNTMFEMAMPLSGLVTVVAGFLLFYRVSDHFNSDWMGSTQGIVLSIASLAGLTAFLHGGAIISRVTRATTALMREIEAQGTPPSEAQMSLMRTLQARTRMHGQISVGLMLIAIIGMVSSKYL